MKMNNYRIKFYNYEKIKAKNKEEAIEKARKRARDKHIKAFGVEVDRIGRKIKCEFCDYEWNSKSEKIYITCPNCKRSNKQNNNSQKEE